ncbi:MAG: type III-B CRISPR module-associated protein Cmr3 [Methanotrichaceae archaeon]|nr:type III-B CRISPR module-associated protein Cmr3 [Methanotrichaceae archaeon]
MSTVYLAVTPHDPIIARDGRPFGKDQGIRMRSLDWPYPSVLAGSLRTMLGKTNGGFSEDVVKALLKIKVAGPLPMKGEQLFLPIPKDILAKENDEIFFAIPLRPAKFRTGEGCDLPKGGLLPTMLPDAVDEDFKPSKMPTFWSMSKMIAWLTNSTGSNFSLCSNSKSKGGMEEKDEDDKKCWKGDSDFLEAPEKDERVHVGIDGKTGASEDGLLFMSVALDLAIVGQDESIHLAAMVETDNVFGEIVAKLDEIHPFGGERRLARWARIEELDGWNCPKVIASELSKSTKIRMIIATPAIFSNGWVPAWLETKRLDDGSDVLEGTPPGAPGNLKLRLISACIDRWKPISGWSAEAKSRGPKAIRRLVPAGSVYFFEAQPGSNSSELGKLWLRSVCDKEEDRKDGFGLAVWGIWEEAKEEDIKDKR